MQQSIQRCSRYLCSHYRGPQHLSALQFYSSSTTVRNFSAETTKPKSHLQPKAAHNESIRLSKLIASKGLNMQMSRKSAEMLIQAGQVTLANQMVLDPGYKISLKEAANGVKVAGRLLRLPEINANLNVNPKLKDPNYNTNGSDSLEGTQRKAGIQPMRTRVWLAHKLAGELVAEHDPEGRPSLIERLQRGGVGKSKRKQKGKHNQPVHLKAIGRLDMITEGLILITNDGEYKREMELPSNTLHRTYRVRVHGLITPGKLKALRNGMAIKGVYYKGMKVNIETNKGNRAKGGNTNTWLRITCVEGKNRQIRRTLDHLGLRVTRLIRTSFGDYDLNTIPPGMAIEVPVKSLASQKKRGQLSTERGRIEHNKKNPSTSTESETELAKSSPVQWIRYQ